MLGDELSYGYIDHSGRVVIPPRFEFAGLFVGDYANVVHDGERRVVTREGELLEAEEAGVVIESWLGGCFALREREGDKVAFSYPGQERRTGFEYEDYRGRFAAGLLAVQQGGRYGFLGRDLEKAIPFRFVDANEFSGGFAAVSDREGWSWIDTEGGWLTGRRFARVTRFGPSGVAAAKDEAGWHLVDSEGAITRVAGASHLGHFSEGLAVARSKSNQKYGYVDAHGAFQIAPRFERARPFSEGLAAVRVYGEKESGRLGNIDGYIDRSGEMVIVMEGTGSLGPFVDGLARVFVDGRHGHIDRDGEWVDYEASPEDPG